jgi:tetratricopeptide (TPR) repeat protein
LARHAEQKVDTVVATLHSFRMAEGKSNTTNFAELESRAITFERERKLEEARDAFDAALRIDPASQSCAEGRARIAIQLRAEDAAAHCARALKFRNDDPELQSQMIATAAAELGIAAIPLLKTFLRRQPEDVRAQELMADLQAQAGAGDSFIDGFHSALSEHPENKPLLMSYWNVLSRSGRHDQAIESMDANRSLFSSDRDFTMLEVAIANHCGLTDRASRLLDQLDSRPDAQILRGLNRLQRGRPGEAVTFLESAVAGEPDNFEAWSLLELSWRITGDHRHDWLVGQKGLYGASELDLSSSELADIAATLRSMHRANAQPLGQSVRGGTQTAGQLFIRHESEITTLTDALGVAIRQFVSNLPAADARHPLLKYRNMGMAFGPSWSVRLTEGGFHAAHFHPGGVLSSACYISLPDNPANDGEKPGWLELGRPPVELGFDLPPIATFEPKPGRLVLFPSFLFHGTRPFKGGERLTVAFDLVPVAPN